MFYVAVDNSADLYTLYLREWDQKGGDGCMIFIEKKEYDKLLNCFDTKDMGHGVKKLLNSKLKKEVRGEI